VRGRVEGDPEAMSGGWLPIEAIAVRLWDAASRERPILHRVHLQSANVRRNITIT